MLKLPFLHKYSFAFRHVIFASQGQARKPTSHIFITRLVPANVKIRH